MKVQELKFKVNATEIEKSLKTVKIQQLFKGKHIYFNNINQEKQFDFV